MAEISKTQQLTPQQCRCTKHHNSDGKCVLDFQANYPFYILSLQSYEHVMVELQQMSKVENLDGSY